MASSSPPRDAITLNGFPPKANSDGGSLSPRMEQALDFIQDARKLGLTVGPAIPDDATLSRVAAKAGLDPEDVLAIYLAVLNPDPDTLQ